MCIPALICSYALHAPVYSDVFPLILIVLLLYQIHNNCISWMWTHTGTFHLIHHTPKQKQTKKKKQQQKKQQKNMHLMGQILWDSTDHVLWMIRNNQLNTCTLFIKAKLVQSH